MVNEEKKHKIRINGQILEQVKYYKYRTIIILLKKKIITKRTIIEYNEKVDQDITERIGTEKIKYW